MYVVYVYIYKIFNLFFQRVGPSIRSGPSFCPRITFVESKEILVSSGTDKSIKVKVDNIAVSLICVDWSLFY